MQLEGVSEVNAPLFAAVGVIALAKTPAWNVAVVAASRNAIMNDPAWKDGKKIN
jgi:homoserine acetyltransferase